MFFPICERLFRVKARHHLASLTLFSGIVVSLAVIQTTRLSQLLQPVQSHSQTQIQRQQQVEAFRLQLLSQFPSMGFSNMIANWSFLNFLQYFGDSSQRGELGYGLSPYFFEIIVDRDPRFIKSYIYLSTSMSLYAGEAETAVELMATGLSSMSPTLPASSHFVWRYKAIDQLLFLGDGNVAKESFLNAADWADQSPDPNAEAVAETSRRTAAFLEKNAASRAAQIGAWAQVLIRAVDDRTVQLATEKIESLGGEITVSGAGRVSVRHSAED